MTRQNFITLVSAFLVLLFTYAACSKLADFDESMRQMMNQTLPRWFSSKLMYIVPPLEIILAFGLMFDRTRRRALLGSTILMAMFTVYIAAVMLHFFKRVPCSCGGVLKHLGWGQHLVFNIVVLFGSFIATWMSYKTPTQSPRARQVKLSVNH